MTILFFILIALCAVVLGFFVLIQNPKGGGLSGNIAGFSNQFMGVKQTTDVLEKGTWIFSTIIALLCVFSSFFMTAGTSSNNGIINQIDTRQSPSGAPAQPAPQNTPPVTPANP